MNDDQLMEQLDEDAAPDDAAPATKKARRVVIHDPGLRALAAFSNSLEKQTQPERIAAIRWLAARYKVIV